MTAMRYAGIDITKEKKPAHVDSVVLDEVDRKKLKDWFEAQPLPKDAGEREKLLEVKTSKLRIYEGAADASKRQLCRLTRAKWSVLWGETVPANRHFPS